MSTTAADFAKITQMLDAGWRVSIRKDGTYMAYAEHDNVRAWERARDRYLDAVRAAGNSEECVEVIEGVDFDEPGLIHTDDFTPEQALTRLAYKVHGEFAPDKDTP